MLKLQVSKLSPTIKGFVAITDAGTDGKNFWEEVQIIDTANRFVLCVNSHDKLKADRDELLEACKAAHHILNGLNYEAEISNDKRGCCCDHIVVTLSQAISNAESEV